MPESPQSPQQPNLLWTPEIEATIELWRQTGEFPFPELRVYPQPQWRALTTVDLRLVHHLSSISNEMFRNRTSKSTLWTDMMPKFLSIAATHPFVMHSILAFSASHLAWISQSTETRNLAFHHASLALKGLHDGITNFTKHNSDAVLAASLLLAWQATDWRGWASLVTGTKTVIQSMQPWRHESLFADYIAEHTPMPNRHFMNPISTPIPPEARREHMNALVDIHASLQRLQPYLVRNEQESKWVDQLKGYLDRLRSSSQPQSPEEQFNQLYALRKWLFWVPISLLAAKRGDVNVLVVLAHFYATALALEPMFPDVASVFVADLSLRPLEEINNLVQGFQDPRYDSRLQTMSYLVQFPIDMVSSYKTRREWSRQQMSSISPMQQQSAYALESINLDLENHIAQYSYGQSLSPAFAPSPLTFLPSGMTSAPTSPYLEVPRSGTVDAYGTASSYASSSSYASPLGSPAALLPPYSAPQEHAFAFGMQSGYPSGNQMTSPMQIVASQPHHHSAMPDAGNAQGQATTAGYVPSQYSHA
ncbi:c6 transcription factor protein [Alternaria burnsii]|uniref:C6 transcription factor protein n=1 Tax=Alternaria burnsii TaxID=1187904 RepID=A0A8H7EDB3_9PLEO|nr:c6 transcription factor protein [Alternaria burnsii]KAF7675552.1 c6 transcription factor protein [Alternaria burnsii]